MNKLAINIILIYNRFNISKLFSVVVFLIPQKTSVKRKLDINKINNMIIECLYLTKINSSISILY